MQGYKDLLSLCYTFLLFYTDPEQILMSKRSLWQTFHISLKHKTIIKHFSAVNFNYHGSLSITWINIFLSTESNSEAMLSTTLITFYWYFETVKQHFTQRGALHRQTLNKQVKRFKQPLLAPETLLTFCISILDVKFQEKPFCSACLFNYFHNLHLETSYHPQELSCWLYAEQLKRQKYTLKYG